MGGPPSGYNQNNAAADQRIAPRGVHIWRTRPLGHPCPCEAGHSTSKRADGSPKSQAPIYQPAPAGGAKESYIGHPFAQVTFRNVIHWGRVQRAR